jgi:hypothetical protein
MGKTLYVLGKLNTFRYLIRDDAKYDFLAYEQDVFKWAKEGRIDDKEIHTCSCVNLDTSKYIMYLDLRDVEFKTDTHGNTGGKLCKAITTYRGEKVYIKTSEFHKYTGIIGNESISEYIASNIARQMGLKHIRYDIAMADITVDGKEYTTLVCGSRDYKGSREILSLEEVIDKEKSRDESIYELCVRNGWEDAIKNMMIFDYIIMNEDRHARNIEIYSDTWEIVPLFDNGRSLLYNKSEEFIEGYKYNDTEHVNNCVGHINLRLNIDTYIRDKYYGYVVRLEREATLGKVAQYISKKRADAIWDNVSSRHKYIASLLSQEGK